MSKPLRVCASIETPHRATVLCMAMSPDDMNLIIGSRDSTLSVWKKTIEDNQLKFKLLKQVHGHSKKESRIMSISWLNRLCFVSCGLDNTVRVWKLDESSSKIVICLTVLRNHVGALCAVELTERLLLVGNYDESISVFCLQTSKCLRRISDPNQHIVSSMAYIRDQGVLATTNHQTINLISAKNFKVMSLSLIYI
eukprot:TRINITY_DN3178_c1_g1_i1.p1 TRINITY_DN3178_c1_g1~~TRINITY_DN3178_c1_g1_i1.p1  ORF type:complete len:196 (+),score=16.27 TRINITY_DN3178_c1_g1_i1:58-645(+)